MNEEKQIEEIALVLGLTESKDKSTLTKQWLANQVNKLIDRDFSRLISILYRVDVSEKKLRALLEQHPGTDAGLIIADLLIERQTEKNKSREKNKQEEKDIDENEKW